MRYNREVYMAKLREIRDRFYAGEELSEAEISCILPFLQGKVVHLSESLRISSVRRALEKILHFDGGARTSQGKYARGGAVLF